MPELWTGTIDLAGSNNLSMKSAKSFRPPEQLVAFGVSDAGTAATAIAIATACAVVAGTATGALNGLLVARIKFPLLVTLAFELLTGLAILITGGKPGSGLAP